MIGQILSEKENNLSVGWIQKFPPRLLWEFSCWCLLEYGNADPSNVLDYDKVVKFLTWSLTHRFSIITRRTKKV